MLFGLMSFAVVYSLQYFGWLQGRELRLFDNVYFHQPHGEIDKRIVLIHETESDIHRYGHPLSDQILAEVLMKLEEAGAMVIGVDKYRDIPVAISWNTVLSPLSASRV